MAEVPDFSVHNPEPDTEPGIEYAACLAQSLDGKIAPQGTSDYVRLGSDYDIAHLKQMRDGVDALIMGGKTLRAYPKLHDGKTHGAKSGVWLPHVVFTRTYHWDWNAPWAQGAERHGVPIVFCSPKAPYGREAFPWCHWVPVPPVEGVLDRGVATNVLAPVDRYLREIFGVQRALIEGGGEVMGLYMMAQWLQSLHVTVCPLVLGGEDAPSIVSGVPGWSRQEAPTLRPVRWDCVGEECYLEAKVCYPGQP